MTAPVARDSVRSTRFVAEALLAVVLTVVVFVQTERLADGSARQSEELMRSSELLENQRFVRETVIGDSAVLPFSNLDLRQATLRGLHFGCTDGEREALEGEKDSGWSPSYVGMNCKADFSESNLSGADLQGAQLRLAVFEGATLDGTNLALTNLIYASFSRADLRSARLDYAYATSVRFDSSDLSGASMTNAYLVDAEFIDSNLSDVDLRKSDLTGASFTRVTCERTQWPEGFTPPPACAGSR